MSHPSVDVPFHANPYMLLFCLVPSCSIYDVVKVAGDVCFPGWLQAKWAGLFSSPRFQWQTRTWKHGLLSKKRDPRRLPKLKFLFVVLVLAESVENP